MRGEVASVIVVVALLVGAGIGYLDVGRNALGITVTTTETVTEQSGGTTNAPTRTITSSVFQTVSTTLTVVSTIVSTAPARTVTSYDCGLGTNVVAINASKYCTMDVSDDIVIQNPGYGYFRNGSVYFMGVKFATICPPTYSGCPGSQTVTTVSLGAIRFNMTFPDGKVETSGAVIGDLEYLAIISNHVNPKAGMTIQYVGGGYQDRVFLLVSYFGS